MQKIMQKVTSVALAASMLFSMMSTTALAFADETGDSTSVSTDVTDVPAAEEADAVDSGSSNDADSSDATSAPTITDIVDLTHESYEDANSNDETTQDATSDVVDGEETSESDANDTEVSTPETAEPTFVGLQTVTPEYGDKLTADVGDSITLDALLNRDDVSVTYQWQRKQNFAVDTALALYNYEEDEPTWYDFVWEDSTEAETLESTPDFTWQGCEMYFAIVDALDEIGADSSDVQVAWHTPNFVLDGYSISAGTAEDGTTEIYASNEENTYTARVNDEGKWEFSDESTANLKNDWQDIEGATESTYTFEVTEDDLFATYRCRITVTDEAYREENFKALEDLGNELTDEDKAGDIILQTVQFSVSLPEDENSSDVATQNMPDTVAMLAEVLAEYRQWWNEHKAMYGDAWRGEWECLFVGDDGTPLNPSTINEWLDKLTERNGLPHVTVHSLRHLCATLLIRTHADPKTVQTILRHANVSTTLNIYAKVFDSTQMEAIGRVQASLENMLKESCSSSAQV